MVQEIITKKFNAFWGPLTSANKSIGQNGQGQSEERMQID
jgi:hypothetical protein